MTVEEFRTFKLGDMFEHNFRFYELIKIHLKGISTRIFTFKCDPEIIIVEEIGDNYVVYGKTYIKSIDNDVGFDFKKCSDKEAFGVKYNVRMIRENQLESLIPQKETELENLKKEYEEIKRKKMLDQIIPGNVYRVTFVDDMCAVAYVRETCDEKTYFVNIINDNYYSFYTRDIKNAELLPELTEAYKNFKTILESA